MRRRLLDTIHRCIVGLRPTRPSNAVDGHRALYQRLVDMSRVRAALGGAVVD